MAIDKSLPISNKGTNGEPIKDAQGNVLQGVEIVVRRLVLNDTNSDGEGDEITDSKLIARTQTDSNGEYEFTSNDLPPTYQKGANEEVYYCAVRADYLESGSGDPLDNGRFYTWSPPEGYITAYALETTYLNDAIHAWRFDEGSGTTVADDINSADGTINGDNMWLSDTKYVDDYALTSDGTDDYVQIPKGDIVESPGSYLVDGPVAIVLTVDDYAGDTSTDNLMGNSTGSNEGFIISSSRNNSGSVEVSFTDDTSTSLFVETDSGGYIDDQNPHRVVVQKTGNFASDCEIWVDGDEKAASNLTGDNQMDTFTGLEFDPVFFANNDSGSVTSYTAFTMDFPKIVDDALTQTEIQDDYNAQPWV